MFLHRGDLVLTTPEDKIGIVAADVPSTHSFAGVLVDGCKFFIHVSRVEKISK